MSSISVLSTLERPTQSAHVARHLLALVAAERLKPGDFVPSEIKIGKDLQVSRGSVREAYRTLAALGILTIEPGRRPRLRPIDSQFLTQVFDYALNTSQVNLAHVLETRRAIEIQSAQLAARYATEAQRRMLMELASQMRSAMADHARRVAADMSIHGVIAEASGNPLNVLLLGALRSPVEESSHMHFDDRRDRSELVRVIDAHEALVDRICAGDAVGAASAMSYHFDQAMVHVNRQEQPALPGATPASRVGLVT